MLVLLLIYVFIKIAPSTKKKLNSFLPAAPVIPGHLRYTNDDNDSGGARMYMCAAYSYAGGIHFLVFIPSHTHLRS